MDRSITADHHRFDESHWWFVGRRAVVSTWIGLSKVGNGLNLLDVGSGAGGMLPLLLPHGSVSVIETDPESAAFLRRRYGDRIRLFEESFDRFRPTESFDVISLFDVLEHIENDGAALEKIRTMLKPGGQLICTVPACPMLWSGHDVLSHHFRRYTKKSLRASFIRAGFEIERMSYFNTILFLPVLALRAVSRLFGREQSDFRIPTVGLNQLLARVFSCERYLLRAFPFPIGVSLIVTATKKKHANAS